MATGALQSSAAEVIDNRAQYEVFDDPRAVSFLSLFCCGFFMFFFDSLIRRIHS